jgi:hypothetical protein
MPGRYVSIPGQLFSYLEQLFIIPVWVDICQLAGNPIVLAHPQSVHCY